MNHSAVYLELRRLRPVWPAVRAWRVARVIAPRVRNLGRDRAAVVVAVCVGVN